jgi:hypothetical protein
MGTFLSLINPVASIIDRILPDKAANDAAKANLLQMQLKGELDASVAQVQVDLEEAKSQSIFVAGWRPFVGWACGFAFAYAYIVQPFIQVLLVAFHSTFDATKLPTANLSEMMPVLLGMLGLAAARTVEKVQGISAGH